ncbi:MAG: crossover junction endodeoxyribonuclease RuvC [Dehalococcoidia bacterium]|nr:crossover junction endodeoxyribonuclease RuvC [Dehalococcoidia bacterium]
MRVLGIDPGTVMMGYGVVEGSSHVSFVDCGTLRCSARKPVEERLCALFEGISGVIATHCPDEVAIEEPFVGVNVQSAFMVGRAQAIAILAASRCHLPITYYSPAEVKRQVSGYGRSDKTQIRTMVMLELGVKDQTLGADATDALAIALCHFHNSLATTRMAGGQL